MDLKNMAATCRYSAQLIPGDGLWGVWDRRRARFLPCHGDPDGDSDREEEHFDYPSQIDAENWARAFNNDSLGEAERSRREQADRAAQCRLRFAVNGWYVGRKDDAELRAVIEECRDAARLAEVHHPTNIAIPVNSDVYSPGCVSCGEPRKSETCEYCGRRGQPTVAQRRGLSR